MATLNMMHIYKEPQTLFNATQTLEAQGRSIALVPTMGALHEGHVALVKHAQEQKQAYVIVSIFVNPAQFGVHEDLQAYPKTFLEDQALLESLGVDALFFPTPAHMYPKFYNTYVGPKTLGQYLCGASRPVHFKGVCTVVLMLFNLTHCTHAYFGEKDFQQLQIIKQMQQDLWLKVKIESVPTFREPSGLAMSSRNKNLTAQELKEAPFIYSALLKVQHVFKRGVRARNDLLNPCVNVLTKSTLGHVDYIELVHIKTLSPVKALKKEDSALLAVAFNYSKARLIDNIVLQ